jgi:hypothetical protein
VPAYNANRDDSTYIIRFGKTWPPLTLTAMLWAFARVVKVPAFNENDPHRSFLHALRDQGRPRDRGDLHQRLGLFPAKGLLLLEVPNVAGSLSSPFQVAMSSLCAAISFERPISALSASIFSLASAVLHRRGFITQLLSNTGRAPKSVLCMAS